MPAPRVSVVMAAFNADAYIGEAVASVVAQTIDDWEVIVVDDGSTDETAERAERFGDARIRVLRTERSGVLGAVRNHGIGIARGQFIALLDADDIWYPRKLERQLELLANPAVGVVHARAEQLVGDRVQPREGGPLEASPIASLVRENFIVSSSVVFRRSLVEMHGPFDTDPALKGVVDYELWLRLFAETTFAFVDEPLLAYRVHAAQMSVDRRRVHLGTLMALEKSRSKYPDLSALFSRSIGILQCVERVHGRGRRELLKALVHNPRDRLAWGWLVRSLIGVRTVAWLGRAIRRLRYR